MSNDKQTNSLISDAYRQANLQLHEVKKGYGAFGGRWAETVKALIVEFNADSILDYGCGKGTLAVALAPLTVHEYDPAVPGKDGPPPMSDLVVCTDVLEHIEPELLNNVLADIHRLAKKAAFLNISTRPAGKFLEDGRNAHLIVERPEWWREKLEQWFKTNAWQVDAEKSEVNCVVVSRT